MPNIYDGLLVAIVAGTMFWGWKTGLLRLAIALTAALAAFTVAKGLYEPIGSMFSDFAAVRFPGFYHALAYLLVVTFTAAVWFVVIHRVYPYTRLTDARAGRGARALDGLGGMLLGLVLGVLIAVATTGVLELMASARWPVAEASGMRQGIHYAIQGSTLVHALLDGAPGLVGQIAQWIPGIEVTRDGRIQT